MVLNIDPDMRQRARAALPPGTGASKHLFQCYMNASHGGCLFAKRDGATCPFVHEDPKQFRWSTLTRILAAEHGGPLSGPRIPHDLHVASKHVESLKALQAYEDRPQVTNPRVAAHNPREARGVPVDELHSGLVALGPHASGKATGQSDATIAVRVQQPTVADLRDLQSRYGTPAAPERVGHMEVLDMPQSGQGRFGKSFAGGKSF